MIKVRPSITVDLEKTGQRITLDVKDAKELYNTLAKFLSKRNNNVAITNNGRRRPRQSHSNTVGATTNIMTTYNDSKKGKRSKGKRRGRKPSKSSKMFQPSSSMSEAKRKEIIEHISKQLSDTNPRTLTNLLKGVSYVPNNIPWIRQMIESQEHVAKKKIGKRTYYLSKGSKLTAAA